MSLSTIDHNATTAHTDAYGTTWWSNPKVNVILNSKGELHKNDASGERIVGLRQTFNHHQQTFNPVRYNIIITGEGKNAYTTSSFNALFTRMVLGMRLLPAYTLALKNKRLGFSAANVRIVTAGQPRRLPKTSDIFQPVLQLQIPSQPAPPVKAAINLPTDKQAKFYTVVQGKTAFRTEDFAIFPTKALADWHQESVSKAKGNAQIVRDYNGGWQCAEAIFQQDAIYMAQKPYDNFRDVMDNNTGVVDLSEPTHATFDVLQEHLAHAPLLASCVSKQLLTTKMSVASAEVIQEQLEVLQSQICAYLTTLEGIREAKRTLSELILQQTNLQG